MSLTFLRNNIIGNQVDQSWQNQAVGARTFDADLMMCPMWTGTDLAGRPVCKDSFYTKRAGCNSALDRIKVEDALRPRYGEFLYNAQGIEGVGANYGTNGSSQVFQVSNDMIANRRMNAARISGQFGNVAPNTHIGTGYFQGDLCASNAYENCGQMSANSMATGSQTARAIQNLSTGYNMPSPNGGAMMPGQGGSGVQRPLIGPGGVQRPMIGPGGQQWPVAPGQGGGGVQRPIIGPGGEEWPVAPGRGGGGILPPTCNPNTTQCSGLWKDEMVWPFNPRRFTGDYNKLGAYDHRSGQYI